MAANKIKSLNLKVRLFVDKLGVFPGTNIW